MCCRIPPPSSRGHNSKDRIQGQLGILIYLTIKKSCQAWPLGKYHYIMLTNPSSRKMRCNEKPCAIPEEEIVPINTVYDALVLASTREMARLIAEFMEAFGEHLSVKVCACVGSKRNSIRKNQQSLSSGVHVVVGTSRRVLYLLTSRSVHPHHIKVFVLDEADKLLSCGYKDQIYDIFHLLPAKVQRCLFLTTLNPEALEIMKNFVRKPLRIIEKHDELEGMKQFYVIVEKEKWKFEILFGIFKTLAMSKSIIYVRSPRYVEWLADKKSSRGLFVCHTQIHGPI